MNIILTILSVAFGLVGLILIVALFTKKAYTISRTVVIDRPVIEVYNYVKYLKNQDFYSKWVMMDPGMKKEFRGTDGTPGFVYAWDSINKQAGKGEQEIVRLTPNERTDIQIRFERPFKGVSNTVMTTEQVGTRSTKVTWIFDSAMNYPMNAVMLFMDFDKVLGKDMESSLGRLKFILEENKPIV